jgi:hypothetical protein
MSDDRHIVAVALALGSFVGMARPAAKWAVVGPLLATVLVFAILVGIMIEVVSRQLRAAAHRACGRRGPRGVRRFRV